MATLTMIFQDAHFQGLTFSLPERERACSVVEQMISAPAETVWPVVRDFGQPQVWGPFITDCELDGDIRVGAIRRVSMFFGFPGTWQKERLEVLDDRDCMLVYSVLDGDCQTNGASVTVCVREGFLEGQRCSVVQQCYLVTPPLECSKEDTLVLIDTLSRQSLRSLAIYAENKNQEAKRRELLGYEALGQC